MAETPAERHARAIRAGKAAAAKRASRPKLPPSICRAPGCARVVAAKDLCHRHYKRRRRGAPLIEAERLVGSLSGFGQLGVMTYDAAGDHVMCHECGQWFRALSSHINSTHGLSGAEYRVLHGIARKAPLVAPLLSQTRRERMRELCASPDGRHWREGLFRPVSNVQASAAAATANRSRAVGASAAIERSAREFHTADTVVSEGPTLSG